MTEGEVRFVKLLRSLQHGDVEEQQRAWEALKQDGIEDDLMSGLKRLADREAFLNTDTAKPPVGLICEDVGPKR